MKTTRVKRRSIVFTYPVAGWDLNIHLIVGGRFNYLIDTGLGSLSIAPVLEHLKGSRNPLIVINTHHHWDHVWGNHAFAGDMIISHSRCRDQMESKWDEMLTAKRQYIQGEANKCLPNMVFDETLYFPEDRIRLFHTPGHTFDSISVLDEAEGVLNAGDNIGDTMEELVPSIETDTKIYAGTIMRYKEMDVQACVSGHNGILDSSVFEMIRMLLE